MENPQNPETAQRISALLSQTAEAHDRYERAELGGVYDQAWPAWYAAYLLDNGLPGFFPGGAARERLRTSLPDLLAEADKSHRANAPAEKWQDYYAAYLITALR
jgi:hypothetical protein